MRHVPRLVANPYKSTIRLPRTEFPMRAKLAAREPEMLARWAEERVYERALQARAKAPRFVFHDGPPYANGHLHHGHVLNKTLKDIIVKYQLLAGRLTRFVPGWDCHGLPIELNVERRLVAEKKPLDTLAVREACRVEAMHWVDTQRAEFQRLGCFGTWEKPYLTLDPGYERGILEALAAFLRHGLVYRGKKPVHWCSRCQTALAEAEVQYADHTSPSIYVKFPFDDAGGRELAKRAGLDAGNDPLHAVIWTTTPWTLPANLAIALHPDAPYIVLDVGGERWLVAEALAASVLAASGREERGRSKPVNGEQLAGLQPRHPFEDRASPLLLADHVTLDTGTGLVHTAPGHGVDDYRLGQEHGLEPFAPVDAAGKFTDEVREAWRGMHVFEANPHVVHFLAQTNRLANSEGDSIAHSYPSCWRCKTPIVFRATTQWFIAIDKPLAGDPEGRTLRRIALDEIEAIAAKRDIESDVIESGWVPEWGRDRIHGMLVDRPDWCISRQRAWGVPIPALHCQKCQEPLLNEALVQHVAEIVGREGADAWTRRDASELAPPDTRCGSCGGTAFDKDDSILDVWFESGASFWSTMRDVEQGFGVPVDLYLEGSDQHRGWFHSSLLVGAALIGRAPYKRVLTHGFVCDEQGRPYSKSDLQRRREAGEKVEYIDPAQLIDTKGAELLRLWVAYEDFRNDVRFSREHLDQVSDAYFKIRNTVRFLLGTLADHEGDAPLVDPLDRWAAARLRRYLADVVRAYEGYEFGAVFHRTLDLCVNDWSSFYFDVLKDRLYCDAPDAPRRCSSQTVLANVARSTIAALAPIIPFTADEAWRHLPGTSGSVFLEAMLTAPQIEPDDERLLEAGRALAGVRAAVNASLEPLIKDKTLPHRREAELALGLPTKLQERIALVCDDLSEGFAVANVTTRETVEIEVAIARAKAPRCERCWRHRPDVGATRPDLCERCVQVLAAEPAS